MNEDVELEATNNMDGAQAVTATAGAKGDSKSNVSHAKINAQKESFWHDQPHLPCSNGQVHYEAFRKIVDYFYLNDLTMLDSIQDSSEILEIIKLSKLYKLEGLFKAAEAYF